MRYVLLALLLSACYTAPTSIAPERAPTPVTASMERTWRAVIDEFADRNIPIRTIDHSSGFVATDALHVADPDSVTVKWADCGSGGGSKVRPEFAIYNVLVRGDSARSTVRVTVNWSASMPTLGGAQTRADCVTTGAWETNTERAIKARTERRAP